MIDLFAVLQELTIPMGAGPGSPRITLTRTIPTELASFYNNYVPATTTFSVNAAILSYDASGNYEYEVNLTQVLGPSPGLIAQGVGFVVSGVVQELYLTFRSNITNHPSMWFGTLAPSDIKQTFGELSLLGGFLIDGVSQGRGRLDRIDTTVSSGAIGAETIVLTGNNVTFTNGRAYEVITGMQMTHSAAQFATLRIRKTNLAGLNVITHRHQVGAAASNNYTDRAVVVRIGGTDFVGNLVASLTASAGTVTMFCAAPDLVAYMEINDIGAAAGYPNAPTV
jgi:hypothetical protein